MKKIVSFLALAMFSITTFAQTTLKSDPYHSRIQFLVTHLTISDITGNFDKADLTIQLNEKDFTQSKLTFNVDVNSINTHIEPRDKHLRSADFFDVEKYPSMTFTSKSIRKIKRNQYLVNGILTMRGISKPVTVTLIHRGSTINQMNKKNTHGYQVIANIKRSDFGVGTGYPNAVISDVVKIKGDFEMTE